MKRSPWPLVALMLLPTLARRTDLPWSGAALFYALVLWFCSGQVRGALLLGQLVQSLERPAGPTSRTGAAAATGVSSAGALPPHRQVPSPNPLPVQGRRG